MGPAGFIVIVPARRNSSRLPGKMLADIGGRPMVVRVAQRARLSGARQVVVATDDREIAQAVQSAGIDCRMTSPEHPTGTDRLSEAARLLALGPEEIVVNVQGDEPLIDPAIVAAVAQALAADGEAAIATAAHAIHDPAEVFNPNVVKVVCDAAGRALYFSRAPIPWARDAWGGGERGLPAGLPVLRHVGLYAYRVGFLRRYAALAPSPLEHWEALEQLRALWHGYRIRVLELDQAPAAGVDTQEDLERVRAIFAAGGV